MTAEELTAYVEKVRAKHRERAKHYYDEVFKKDPEKYAKFLFFIKKTLRSMLNFFFFIKKDPEKYAKFLNKCQKANKTYYHSKDTNKHTYVCMYVCAYHQR
jgi:hypothetical protein